jgi:hypothetical protein
MFNFVFNKDLGSGYLFFVNQSFTKSNLDQLRTVTITNLKLDSRVLAFCPFSDLTQFSKSRAIYSSSNVNAQVPRYGQVYYPSITGLGTVTQLRSGLIQGGVLVIGDPVTNAAYLTYGTGAEIMGSHKAIALGSPAPTLTFNQNVTYT